MHHSNDDIEKTPFYGIERFSAESCIEKFDKFGQNIIIPRNQREKFKTNCGGLVSLGIIFFTIGILATQLNQLLLSEKFSLTPITLYEKHPQPELLTKSSFMVAIGLNPNEFNSISLNNWEYPLVIPEFWKEQYNYNESTKQYLSTRTIEELEYCTKSHFAGLEKDMEKLNISQFLCLKLGFSYFLSGTYGDDLYTFLRIRLRKCDNGTLNISSFGFKSCANST